MTQLGEALAIGQFDESDGPCPFDHGTSPAPDLSNKLNGNATTLESNMEEGIGTDLRTGAKTRKTNCPNYDPKHKFYDGKPENEWPVVIDVLDPTTNKTTPHRYPVTCAAHHVIPAHETLELATTLLPYMKKKGRKGKCRSDVGYDVNGAHNGVFLPGNYGVTSVGLPQNLWSREPSAMGDDADATAGSDGENTPKPKRLSMKGGRPVLTGLRHEVRGGNLKWEYVEKAMKMAPGQFHDRHPDYSDKVLEILQNISVEYNVREGELGCDRCKAKFKKAADEGIPTPFALVDRLNAVSVRLAMYLNGSLWNIELYTSKWGLAYMQSVKRRGGALMMGKASK